MLTREGRLAAVAAVVLAVTARFFGSVELYVLAGSLAALVVGARLTVGFTRINLDVSRELHPPRVHAGSPSRVEVRVQNGGTRRSPLLTLRDGVSGTRGARLLVGPLAPGASARAAYRLPTERRGILTVGPLDIELTDPFGLARVALTASGASELTVFPHVDELAPLPLTTGNDPLAGAEHPNSLGRGGEDFYALRDYVVGDDLRRVHWPSTARHDELMVRQDELPWQGRATVLVDVRSSTNTRDSLELVISAAASIVSAGAHRQDLIRLVSTDGADSGFAAGHAHIEAIMEHLASVEAANDAGFRRVLDRLARSATRRRPHRGGGRGPHAGSRPVEPAAAALRLAHHRAVRPLVVGRSPAVGDHRHPPRRPGAGDRGTLVRGGLDPAHGPGPQGGSVVERPDHGGGSGHRPGRGRRTLRLGLVGPAGSHRGGPPMTATATPPRTPSGSGGEPARPVRRRALDPVPTHQPAAELWLTLVTLCVVFGFTRIFTGWDFLGPLAVTAVVTHGALMLARRRGLSLWITTVLAVFGFALLMSWLFFFTTTRLLVPTPDTVTAARLALDTAWAAFQEVVAPTPSQPGFLLAACFGVFFAVFLADWAAFRLWAPVEALVPTMTLLVFTALVGSSEGRVMPEHGLRPDRHVVRRPSPGGRAGAVHRLAGRSGRPGLGLAAAHRRAAGRRRGAGGDAGRHPPARLGRRRPVELARQGHGPELARSRSARWWTSAAASWTRATPTCSP